MEIRTAKVIACIFQICMVKLNQLQSQLYNVHTIEANLIGTDEDYALYIIYGKRYIVVVKHLVSIHCSCR